MNLLYHYTSIEGFMGIDNKFIAIRTMKIMKL